MKWEKKRRNSSSSELGRNYLDSMQKWFKDVCEILHHGTRKRLEEAAHPCEYTVAAQLLTKVK